MSDASITSDETIESVSTETPQANVPEKRCTGTCGRTLPLTTEYFMCRGGNWFSLCRECFIASIQSGRAQGQANHEDKPIPTERVCKDCERTLPLTTEYFPTYSGGLRSVCRECENKKTYLRSVAAKSIRTEDGVPIEKYCISCERTLPLTTEHFNHHKGHGWIGPCKECRLKNSATLREMEKIRNTGTEKCCISCGHTLPLTTEYFVYINGGWHRKCRVCEGATLSTSPQKTKRHQKIEESSGTPDLCGSCGIETGNILGDINDATHETYGYLCAKCFRLMREVKRDAPRTRKVLDYLDRTRGRGTVQNRSQAVQ